MGRSTRTRRSRGMFIALEGGEGSGKSTLAIALEARLRAEGVDVVLTREPGATPLGLKIRELLLTQSATPPTALAELLLYEADRAQHCETVIEPALARGQWVLSDRFTDSSLIYQGVARGLGLPLVRQLNSIATQGLKPDLTLVLDIPPELGLTRAADRRKPLDRLESEPIAFHRKLRQGFLKLAKSPRHEVLDARMPAEALAEAAWQVLPKRGKKR